MLLVDLASAPLNFKNPTMATTPPDLKFDHIPGFEIATEHKNAIRELHSFGKKTTPELIQRYELGRSTIHRILGYDVTTRARPSRTGRPPKLSDARVNEIIEYCSENWEHRIMDYEALVQELGLEYTASTLQKRLH